MTELETLRQQLAAAEAARKDISEMLDRERERTDQFDWETGECTHGLIGNYHTCNGSKNGCERSRFLHCCHCMKKNFAAEAARKEAEQERDRATLSEDALQEKVDTMADAMNELGLTCGCSVDNPGDFCMHHSPRLLAAVKRAEAAERERDAARCDVAHAQFDRDAALNLVEAAEARTLDAEDKYVKERAWQKSISEQMRANDEMAHKCREDSRHWKIYAAHCEALQIEAEREWERCEAGLEKCAGANECHDCRESLVGWPVSPNIDRLIDQREAAEEKARLAATEAATLRNEIEFALKYLDTFDCKTSCDPAENFHQPECQMRNSFREALKTPGPSSAIVDATYPYMCRIGHAQIGHSTDGESCPVCIEKGKTRLTAVEAEALRKASGMMRDELMRLHEIICEEDAQSIETLIKETDALINVPAPSSAILAVVDAARAVADDYIVPSSLILSLRKALRAIDGENHV